MTEFQPNREKEDLSWANATQEEDWELTGEDELFQEFDESGELKLSEPKLNWRREVIEWMEAIVYSLVAVVLVFTFLFRIVGVDGESMCPTLQDQDRLIVTHLFYEPKQGDIIVTTQPWERNTPLIKRIIAVGGQKVYIDFDTHQIWVDDKLLDEPYIAEPTAHYDDMTFPLIVDEGKVFVMGDNRNDSLDSRSSRVGLIDERYILGKAVFRIFPFNSIGGLYENKLSHVGEE